MKKGDLVRVVTGKLKKNKIGVIKECTNFPGTNIKEYFVFIDNEEFCFSACELEVVSV